MVVEGPPTVALLSASPTGVPFALKPRFVTADTACEVLSSRARV
jgi:hypothetical protein